MTACEAPEILDVYLDGELNAPAQVRVEKHLAGCSRCSAELADLQATRASLAAYRSDSQIALLPIELARIQAGVRKGIAAMEARSSLNRVAAALSLIAASILVISGAWLLDMEPATPMAGGTIAATTPEWERVATTLNTQPRPGLTGDESPYFLRYAVAVEWMLDKHVPAE